MSKVAVVTGASKGIGAATAIAFAKAGYNVVINYYHSPASAEEVANSCRSHAVDAIAIKADCNDEAEIQLLADKSLETFGKIDVLVNNYGSAKEPDFVTITQADVVASLTNNLVSAIMVTKIFISTVLKENSAVLNVASVYGLEQGGRSSLPLYSASKAGLINFTQTMAQRYAPHIRFNAVAPGFTKTPAWDGVADEYLEKCFAEALLPEWLVADDIAKALLFLAESPHINAETIVVDAGRSKK